MMSILLIIVALFFGAVWVCLFLRLMKLKASLLENNIVCEALIGKSPDGVFIVSGGKFVYANRKILEITGYSREDFLSLAPSDIIYKAKNEEVNDNFWEVMAGVDTNQQCEMELVSENGEVISAEVSLNFVEYNKKRAVYVALRDITSRKEFEEKLLRTDQYINNIIDCLPNIIAGVDSKANVILMNDEAEKFVNRELSKVLGKKIFDIMPQFSEQFNSIGEVVNRNIIKDFSTIEINSDSKNSYYHLKLIPFIGNHRKSVLVVITDITGIVKFESIVVAADRMFSSADFLNSFILGIKAELNRFEKTFDNFVDNIRSLGKDDSVGHVLQERIINTAKGFTDMRIGLEQVKKSVEQLRYCSPSDELSFKECSVNKIIEDLVQAMKVDPFFLNSFNLGNVDFSSEYDANLPAVLCDPTEIEQALKKFVVNFFESCRDKNEHSKKDLKIIFKTYKNAEYVCISLEDNGDGFNSGIKEIANSQGDRVSDLGVNIANYIIKNRHKGELEVLSRPGVGTKVVIKLKVKQ